MGWTLNNFANADWAQIANIVDFYSATKERVQAAGYGANWTAWTSDIDPAIGDDVQDADVWGGNAVPIIHGLQYFIETILGYYTPSYSGGSPLAPGCYTGSATQPTFYASLADLFADAGLATTTWRAYTAHPTDDVPPGVDQSRKILPGDIIGPWIFEDLQAVINALRWTLIVDDPGDPYSVWLDEEAVQSTFNAFELTWAAAKVTSEAGWPSASLQNMPSAYSIGIRLAPYGYTGFLKRSRAKWAYPSRPVSYVADFYAMPTVAADFSPYSTPGSPNWTYHGQFDHAAPADKYFRWWVEAVNANVTGHTADWLGSIVNKPAWCGQPPLDNSGEWLGWIAARSFAILRFDFSYIDPGWGQGDWLQQDWVQA